MNMELFEYILLALACPLVLPFVDTTESEDERNDNGKVRPRDSKTGTYT